MFPAERRSKIIELLEEKKILKLDDLTKELDISMETLRRDVQQLVKNNNVKKIYGGIELIESELGESLIDQRLNKNLSQKKKIAKTAQSYVMDGDTIFLDSGSTTLQLAKELKHKKNLTVITNSIPIMLEFVDTSIEVICIGGKMRHSEQSIISFDFLFNFDKLNINRAFICTSGITIDKGISDYNLNEAQTRRAIMEISKQVIVVSDASKFNKDVTVKVCDIHDIDILITDDTLDNATINQFEKVMDNLIISK